MTLLLSDYQEVSWTTQLFYSIPSLIIDYFCAGGGEYDVQLGFGWTNGVILDFLHIYGDRLVTEEPKNT